MKRYTHLPQVVLGVAFSWGIPMAFAAVTGSVSALGWLLFLASLLWIVAYDTEYAMVDRRDDVRAGVKSIAILFGRADRAMIGALQAAALGVLVLVGLNAGLRLAWFAALAVAGALFLYQPHLIRDRDESRCFAAFRNNTWVGVRPVCRRGGRVRHAVARRRHRLDRAIDWTGRAVAWLTFAMIVATCVVVVLRYGFDTSAIMLQESVIYMHGMVFMLGLAYTAQHDGHVRVDVCTGGCRPAAGASSTSSGISCSRCPCAGRSSSRASTTSRVPGRSSKAPRRSGACPRCSP